MKKLLIISAAIIVLAVAGTFAYLHYTQPDTSTGNNQADAKTTAKQDIREAVWQQLPAKQQAKIDWQAGKLSKTTLSEGSTISDGNKIVKVGKDDAKEVYLIDFPTDTKAVPNNMIVYADLDTHRIIGYGLVD